MFPFLSYFVVKYLSWCVVTDPLAIECFITVYELILFESISSRSFSFAFFSLNVFAGSSWAEDTAGKVANIRDNSMIFFISYDK